MTLFCARSLLILASALILAGLMPLTAAADDRLAVPESPKSVEPVHEAALGTNEDGIGRKPGDRIEDFSIRTFDGKPASLEALLPSAPLLVVFYRGGWCPYCNFQIRELTAAYPAFEERGVLPILISVDEAEGSSLVQAHYRIPFPVLSDPDLAAHRAFDVLLEILPEQLERYQSFGIDLARWSGRDHHTIAVSSAFLVDGNGVVQWAHTSKDFKTRPTPEQLLRVIDARR